MTRTKYRPMYSLDQAKSLARSGDLFINGRVRRHLTNRFGILDFNEFLSDLINFLQPKDFVKSISLDMEGSLHGVLADVYRCFGFEGEDWYVKFLIDSDGQAHLTVLSANLDGYIH